LERQFFIAASKLGGIRMTEQDLYRKITNLFPAPSHALRVENMIGSGIPDLNICHMGMEAWVECKLVIPGGVILRKEQYAWGMRRAAAGGTIAIIAFDNHFYYAWRFPDLEVSPWHRDNKYVKVESLPHVTSEELSIIKKFLFPGV
jgi:hypothetical protein